VSAVASAATAAATAEILGQYVDGVCGAPADAKVLTVKEVMAMLKEHASLKVQPA
jgi:hypothetical protein